MPLSASPNAAGGISPELDAISRRLVGARAGAQALADFPGELPETLDSAYAIQTASIARWPDQIAGWKVGMIPESYRGPLAAQRLAGPIFQASVSEVEPNSTTTMSIFCGGFAAVEAEFVLRVATDIEPTGQDFADEELVEMVSALHVGVEIASSPMAAVNELGPCCVVSDFGNNAGLLVGPNVPNWSDLTPESLTAAVKVDGAVAGAASASSIEGGLLQVLRYLIDLCGKRQIVLAKDSLISSGALTGIHEVSVDSQAEVDFGPFGVFNVEFQVMPPLERVGSARA